MTNSKDPSTNKTKKLSTKAVVKNNVKRSVSKPFVTQKRKTNCHNCKQERPVICTEEVHLPNKIIIKSILANAG